MSEKFEREMAALLDARKKKQKEDEQQRAQQKATAGQFAGQWSQTLLSVVAPTLERIAVTLNRQGVESQVSPYKENGLMIQMALAERRLGSGNLAGQPRISFEPSPQTQSVIIESDNHLKNVKPADITVDLIEEAVLALTRKYARP